MRISDWSSDVCSSDLRDERLQGHIVTPAPTTERLLSIQRMVADQLGDKLPDFEVDALRAIPVQAGGLYPISDVWYIEPGLDAPDRLRVHIAQFAREIAGDAAVARSEEHTSELQSLMRISYAVFCLKK